MEQGLDLGTVEMWSMVAEVRRGQSRLGLNRLKIEPSA